MALVAKPLDLGLASRWPEAASFNKSQLNMSSTDTSPMARLCQEHDSTASLRTLPVELRQAILASLDDIRSVRAAVVSSPVFYRAFLGSKQQILSTILHRQIPQSLFSDALAVLESTHLQPWTKEGIQDFMTRWYKHRTFAEPEWTLQTALAVSEIQQHVDFFSLDFVSSALSAHPLTGVPDVCPKPPTARELTRVQNAFYRFELYRNLFREYKWRQDRFTAVEQRDVFFAKYSTWENEQLACIHDYLFRRLSIGASFIWSSMPLRLTVVAFNDVAAHDVVWGEYSIPFDDDDDPSDNFWKQHTVRCAGHCLDS